MALECTYSVYIIVLHCLFLCSVFLFCLLSLDSCMCVLSDIDIDWFHTQLSVDKYRICEYVCVCNEFFEDWDFCFSLYSCHI